MGTEPKIVGRYALFSRLDAGGMATVYVGRALGAGGFASTVAIKRLHAHFAQNPEFSRMFLDEARIASRVRHPNVVPVLDVVATDDELFLVMELVVGHALSSLTGDGRRPPLVVAAALVAGTLLGLHAAHTATDELGHPLGLVHRDVSPQNVLVGRDGVPRVIDFGVAKALGRMTATREGELKGKIAYMAPEQVEGHASPLSDVFAAGVLLWELVTGERLFFRGSEAATLLAVTKLEVPLASARLVASSEAERALVAPLDAVLARALARRPEDRYPSALAFAEAIDAAVRPASALEVGRWVSSVAGPALDARARMVAEVEQRSLRLPPMEGTPSSSAPRTSSTSKIAPAASFPPPPVLPSFSSAPPAPRDGTLPSVPEGARPAATRRPGGGRAFALAIVGGLVLGVVVLGAGAVVYRKKSLAPSLASASASASIAPSVGAASVAPSVALASPTCPPGMARIDGGELFVGTDDKKATEDERPAHPVRVGPYCLDLTEVTVAQYKACSDQGKCKRAPVDNEWDGITPLQRKVYDPVCNGSDPERRSEHPVNCVDWDMAARYCREMRPGGSLPSEAEWELAARGSDGRVYPWGDSPPTVDLLNACDEDCVAWGRKHPDPSAPLVAMLRKKDGHATTAPVGSFPAGKTRFGMLDMAGNVWEWVADFHAPYTKTDVTAVDPKGPPSGDERVIRGGAWNGADASWLRPTFRYAAPPSMRSHGIGFRCKSAPAK